MTEPLKTQTAKAVVKASGIANGLRDCFLKNPNIRVTMYSNVCINLLIYLSLNKKISFVCNWLEINAAYLSNCFQEHRVPEP